MMVRTAPPREVTGGMDIHLYLRLNPLDWPEWLRLKNDRHASSLNSTLAPKNMLL